MPGFWRRRTLAVLAISIVLAGCGTTAPPSVAPPTGEPPIPPPASPSPAVDTSAWEPAGALALSRASTHAVALADGRVLVVGNDNICEPGGAWDDSVAAEIYDPAARTWSATGSLNAPRTDFAAFALPDGRVLVAGGLTSADPDEGPFGTYSSTKLYDPASGTWSATGLMGTARTGPVAALLPDGTVLVAGGAYVDDDGVRVLASAEVFDPETATWSRTGSLTTARRDALAVTLADGRVLVVGGDGPLGFVTGGSPEVYDPSTGTWRRTGLLRVADRRNAFALVSLSDGGALIVGGTLHEWTVGPHGIAASDPNITTTASVERLDPGTLRWSPAAPLPLPVTNPAAVLLGDGRVLVAGGISAGTTPDSPGPAERPAIDTAELYDPATDSWTTTTPLPMAREGGSFVTLPDRSVLLVGGDAGFVGEPSTPWCPEPLTAAVRYVPANLASFPPPIAKPTATVAKSDVPRAKASPAAAKKAAASITAFGIDLYQRMLKDGTLDPTKNAVFSPTSIALALGMARAGAMGTTATEMDDVLHTMGWDALGKGLNSLGQSLASRDAIWKDDKHAGGATHELKLRIANAAFAQRNWSIVPAYLDAIATAFGAGLRLVDYRADPEAQRKLINAWVKKQTSGRIPELIPKVPPVIDKLTRFVLVNAIYLKANWAKEFDPDATKPRAFTRLDGSTVKTPTMWLQGEQMVPYAAGPGWKASELRYRGDNGSAPLAMTLILPDDLPAFERTLGAKKLAGVVAKLDGQRRLLENVTYSGEADLDDDVMDCGTYAYSVRLFMPKFGIDTAARLEQPLEALGMPLAFDPARADFTGIHVPEDSGDTIFIGAVIHQANIDVDEKGTEAAAATAVVAATTGGCGGPSPAKTVTLRLNRPFLFLLRDVETGAILFMGRVVDPSAK